MSASRPTVSAALQLVWVDQPSLQQQAEQLAQLAQEEIEKMGKERMGH
jgi:hypothetical protein